MTVHQNVPDELRQRLPHDIRLYIRNFWQHPNDPERDYDFYADDGETFLSYMAHEDGPLVPGNWGDVVVLLYARGCLKTTTATAAAEWAVSEYPMVEVDVTAPRTEQFGEVMDRFKSHVKQSGLTSVRTKNNVSHQKFERQLEKSNGDKVHVEADVKARSAWGDGDGLRGLHGHVGVIDEFQDVDEGMFSTFLEAVDQSVPQVEYFPTIVVIGTPKMANSFFHELWEMSDQKSWDADEEAWISQSDGDEFIPVALEEQREELRGEVEELEKHLEGLIRERWNEYKTLHREDAHTADTEFETDEIKDIRREIEEKTAAADSIEGYKVTGWHIDQYASPLHDDAKIEFKRQKYTKKKFKNEVLAEFYTPENDLLSDKHVDERLIPDKSFTNKREFDDSTVVMGVDWGGGGGEDASDTVIVVGEKIEHDDEYTIVLRDIEFIDSDLNKQDELEEVEKRIRDYQVDRVAVDEGYGAKQREDLQDGNNIWNDDGWDDVCGVIYGNIKDKDKPKFSNNNARDSAFCTVARTHMIEGMVDDFKSGNIDIPAADLSFDRNGDGTMLKDQLTAPYTDRVETSDGKKKLKVLSDRNDDAAHAFTYMWIAANRFGSQRTLKSISTNSRRGY
ncbi:hypothetical protein [Natrinema sp. DC36]|uniref:hypothetical protein n=1 Tax=Natrinema sp. DC36 TaxID=2878680 RepID=UPI001CF00A1B|nr:hypothetical protein [Natrinema sp. DC36]